MNVKALLNEAVKGLIADATEAIKTNDIRAKADAESRIRYLNQLGKELDEVGSRYPRMSLFVSYSKKTGKEHYEKAKTIALKYKFEVVTGFDLQTEATVLKAVRTSISNATLFLGIMTPEYSIRDIDQDRDNKKAPSIWVIEEKGMALALEKPFQLLVDESVHPDFWKKTTPEKLHSMFSSANFEEKAEEALSALHRRYQELLIKSLEYPMP